MLRLTTRKTARAVRPCRGRWVSTGLTPQHGGWRVVTWARTLTGPRVVGSAWRATGSEAKQAAQVQSVVFDLAGWVVVLRAEVG